MMMLMMMTTTMTWNEPARVPMLCVLIYNIKLTIILKYLFFTTFSAHTKKAGQQARARRDVWPWKKRIHTNHYAVSKIAMLSQRYHEVNCRRKGSKPQARCAHVQVLIPHQALIAQALQFCFFQHVFQATNLQVPSHSCTSKWPVSYPFFKALPFFDIAWI